MLVKIRKITLSCGIIFNFECKLAWIWVHSMLRVIFFSFLFSAKEISKCYIYINKRRGYISTYFQILNASMYRIIFLFAVMLVLNSTKKIKKWDQIVISNCTSWGTVYLEIIDTDCMDWHLEWTVYKGNQRNPYGAAYSYKAMKISWLYFKKLLSR